MLNLGKRSITNGATLIRAGAFAGSDVGDALHNTLDVAQNRAEIERTRSSQGT